jgi:hypothetical protein
MGKKFTNKLNYLFSELGWVNKSLKGWIATDQGLKQGAIQSEDTRSGVPYVRWPETITQSRLLLSSIDDITGSTSQSPTPSDDTKTASTSMGYSENIEAKHRATDGHFVRSKAEMLIDKKTSIVTSISQLAKSILSIGVMMMILSIWPAKQRD